MPIGNLLAEITGEKPITTSAGPMPSSLPPKRKADDELKGLERKVQRTGPITNSSSLPGSRPAGSAPGFSVSKPSPFSTASAVTKRNGDAASARPSVPARPSPTTNGLGNGRSGITDPSAQRARPGAGAADGRAGPLATANKPTPKKGSFAEIMARAAAAQKSMGQVGKIQHKPIDKGPSKREREEQKAELMRGSKGSARDTSRRPSARPASQRGSLNGAPSGDRDGRNYDRKRQRQPEPEPSGTVKGEPAGEVKKPKKSAVATTGYQGTARPRPGATTKGTSSSATDAGGNSTRDGPDRSRPRLPSGGSRNRGRRDDYYDDEMDDFIDDDEDEPEDFGFRGRRYSYASGDDESDMEAGISDIDEEERRADQLARREDQEQEALERKLKLEKEARKRRLQR